MNPWQKTSTTEPGKGLPPPTGPASGLPGPALEAEDAAHSQANRLNAEAVKLVAEANESRARQLRELEDILARLQQNLVAEAGRLKQLEDQLRARQASLSESEALCREGAELKRQAQTQVLELQAQFWPAGVRAESWRPWRERLIGRALAEPLAAILLARLHTAAALESSGRPLPLEVVRDLGDSVYEASPEDAEKLAQALTQAAGGRFEIKAVRVGDRIDKRFMQPSAGGLVEVRAVSGWAIRDATGKWQFLADVS
jgi:DNA polymerase III psi subunit